MTLPDWTPIASPTTISSDTPTETETPTATATYPGVLLTFTITPSLTPTPTFTSIPTATLSKSQLIIQSPVTLSEGQKYDNISANMSDPKVPTIERYNVPALPLVTRSLTYSWCAKDETTLQDNWKHTTLQFLINDQEVQPDQLLEVEYKNASGLACVERITLISDWQTNKDYSIKEYTIEIKRTFDAAVNDGINTYALRIYDWIFDVHVFLY